MPKFLDGPLLTMGDLRRRCRPVLWSVGVAIAMVLGSSAHALEGGSPEPERVLLDMAMTEASLGQVSRAEAVVAFQIYAQVYARIVGVEAIVQATVFGNVEELLGSARGGRQKVLGLQVQDYLYVREHVPLDLMFLAERSGRATESYLILVRHDAGIAGLAELTDRSLQTCRGQQMGLASMWLECLLADEGLPASRSFFGDIWTQSRISSAVLPVLLGKADACLVAQSAFETMAELNPQLSRELRVLAASPEVISFVTCIRSDFTGPNRERAERAYLEAHEHPQGRQVLALFGFDRMRRCTAEDLGPALEIIRRYAQLTGAARTTP